jgi:hypothetical protein
MNQVLALLDRTSPAPVTAAAYSLATLLGASVGERYADEAGTSFAPDLQAVVIAGCGPSALAFAATIMAPVLVVPEACHPGTRMRRILVPLEGTAGSSAAARPLIESAPHAGVEIVVVHAIASHTVPAYTDQPQHEQGVWGREFLARHCPWGVDVVQFETRVGPAETVIAEAAQDRGCDAIVLSWAKDPHPARAAVVRATMDRAGRPVLLLSAAQPDAASESG